MDIAEFAAIRPARTVEPERLIRLEPSFVLPRPAGVMTHVPPPLILSGESMPPGLGDPAWDPLREYDNVADASLIARIHALVRACERALTAADDRLDAAGLVAVVQREVKVHELDAVDWKLATGGTTDATVIFPIARVLVRQALITTLSANPPDYERAHRLTRLALVAHALCELLRHPKMRAEQIYDLLHRRPLVIPGLADAVLAPAPKIKLIRETTVRDLQVVRREWAGYVAGEVANVRNVMAGESFSQHEMSTRETETTTTALTERREETETESEAKQTSELTASVSNQLGVTINGHAEVSAEYRYPVVTARISGGVDAGLTLQRSDQQSSKIAREAVARATSRVESLTRETRMRRELARTEEGYTYALRNSTDKHVHGVYRWVDRIDTYQLFRYTDRLQLEFQIPEPAEFYRWRRDRQEAAATAVDAPPEWTLTADAIKAEDLITLAKTYHATNVPPPLEPTVTVVRTVTVETAAPAPGSGKPWNPPTGAKELDIPIPTDYATSSVSFEGEGFPAAGEWTDETGKEVKGVRSAFAAVAVGSESHFFWNGGIWYGPLRFLATHGNVKDIGVANAVQRGEPPYGRSFLPIGSDAGLHPNPVTAPLSGAQNVLKVALTTLGLLTCTVTFAVKCVPTSSAQHAWRLSVYDALFAAWSQWKRDYESRQVRGQLLGESAAADAGSSQRNEQVILEELKRSVIAWLLDDAEFAGRPALKPRKKDATGVETDFANMDIPQAILDAPTIQFLEQAFEWSNLAYVFYPYFWAARSRWEVLSEVTANDPVFERFLRAGSARVVVPARPSFESAVKNWLMTGVPFLNGDLPTPDKKLYISIDTEVREISAPQRGGIPGDHWQSRLTTTLVYLESKGDLPFTNQLHQLPAPVGAPYEPGDILDLDEET
ncbi:hypothetical protein FE374_14320 [Georgenia yuyongxinii]|uniref:Uncharacterized protein n=1 Tax=Georgenia yuyongxinii TaxID=2589797 RepID=A0A5B8C4V7_9MICO|nr:hypothetical protein [Georgenia yuyongxinii]QDC25624.1 hypothetical protein FE374_14320 [Georgenia yuyongxinii]